MAARATRSVKRHAPQLPAEAFVYKQHHACQCLPNALQNITIALSCQVVPYPAAASAGAGAVATAMPQVDRWTAQRTAQQCLSIKYVEDLAEAGQTKRASLSLYIYMYMYIYIYIKPRRFTARFRVLRCPLSGRRALAHRPRRGMHETALIIVSCILLLVHLVPHAP